MHLDARDSYNSRLRVLLSAPRVQAFDSFQDGANDAIAQLTVRHTFPRVTFRHVWFYAETLRRLHNYFARFSDGISHLHFQLRTRSTLAK